MGLAYANGPANDSMNETSLNETSLNETSLNETSLNETSLNETSNENASTGQEWFEVMPVPEMPQNETAQNRTNEAVAFIYPAYKNPFKPGSDLSKFGKQQIRNYP